MSVTQLSLRLSDSLDEWKVSVKIRDRLRVGRPALGNSANERFLELGYSVFFRSVGEGNAGTACRRLAAVFTTSCKFEVINQMLAVSNW